jgi:hypothetical protein
MKMKFLSNGKIEQGCVLLGKNGNIRFKSEFAKDHGFIKGQKWRVGIDADENPMKHIFVLSPAKDNPQEGFKMTFQNKSWALAAKTLFKELNLIPPLKCRIEDFKDAEYEGFIITLSQPLPPHT